MSSATSGALYGLLLGGVVPLFLGTLLAWGLAHLQGKGAEGEDDDA